MSALPDANHSRYAADLAAKVVAVSMEIGLLKRVDKYAKAHSMKRAEMIAKGLQLLMRAG